VRVSITIPAYDEIESLASAVDDARAALSRLPDPAGGEVLIVDDGSRDGTAALADDLAARHRNVRVVHHVTNRGFSGAMMTCFREATGDLVFLAPADGQIAMSELERFLAFGPSIDVVIGLRDHRLDGLHRTFLSAGFHTLSRALFGLPYREFSSAFLFRRSLLAAMPFVSSPRGATVLPEVLARARSRGARIATIEVTHRPRRAGRAKGGQLSVALRTLVELARVALIVRRQERALAQRATSESPVTRP
jgi:glycosyltransferase involved in cell wall biosynthesis